MELEITLQEAGLTKNEAKTYLALLDIGSTTTAAIIKQTGINTSKVYESLERLLKKGLVSYTIIHNKKHWQAEDPNQIPTFLDEEKNKIEQKKDHIKEAIPQLKALQNLKKETAEYRVFEGIKGIKAAREEALTILEPGDTFYLILSTYPHHTGLNAFYYEFQQRRAKKEVKYKAIFNTLFKEEGNKTGQLPLSQVKFVKPDA